MVVRGAALKSLPVHPINAIIFPIFRDCLQSVRTFRSLSLVVLFVLYLAVDLCAVSTLCAFSNFKFGWLSGHLSGKWLPIRLTIFFLVQVPDCKFSFFPPRFLEWEFISYCAIS